MSKSCNANINYNEAGAGLSTDSSGKFKDDCEKSTEKCEEVKLTKKFGADSIGDAGWERDRRNFRKLTIGRKAHWKSGKFYYLWEQ